jgi:hypothetical protein
VMYPSSAAFTRMPLTPKDLSFLAASAPRTVSSGGLVTRRGYRPESVSRNDLDFATAGRCAGPLTLTPVLSYSSDSRKGIGRCGRLAAPFARDTPAGARAQVEDTRSWELICCEFRSTLTCALEAGGRISLRTGVNQSRSLSSARPRGARV